MRRFLRRDRLTGHIAIGVVGVLCAAAVVFGVGMASAKYRLSDVGGWLASSKKGELVHVNGLSGKVDGKVQLKGSTGHQMKVVQQNGVVLIVDQTTGVVSRIDPARLSVVQGSDYRGAAGMQVVSGAGTAYALDPQRGTVQRLDPMRLSIIGAPIALTGPLGPAAIDAKATLWVPVPANGQAATVLQGQSGQPVPIGKPGDDLALTIASGAATVTDFTAAQSVIIGANGTQVKVNLPSQVAQLPKGQVKAPTVTEGQIVPLLAGGSLIMLNTGSGRLSTVSVQVPHEHRLGQPQALGQRVYIPDNDRGSLLVYNAASNKMEREVVVTGRPSKLDAFVKDGMLWVNDPNGNKAVVVDATGSAKPISKYSNDVPGGEKNPVPKAGAPDTGDGGQDQKAGDQKGNQKGSQKDESPGGDVGLPRPVRPGGKETDPLPRLPKPIPTPTPTPTPTKPQPPDAPQPATNVKADPRDGGIDVQFQPSNSDNVTYYTLRSEPAFPGADTLKVKPGETPGFSLNGGECGTLYSFRVLAHWKDQNGKDDPVPSDDPAPQARPCIPTGAPKNVNATATTGGAKVTWAAPSGANSATKYTVAWQGPTSKWKGALTGSKSGISGTSLTLSNIWKNGAYTFTVKAANEAGSNDAAKRVTLTGPTTTVGIHRGGNPNESSFVRALPDDRSRLVEAIKNANTQSLTVYCQVKGRHYTHPNDHSLNGDLWDRINHRGKVGYMIGYLPNTGPDPWNKPVGPRIWECAG